MTLLSICTNVANEVGVVPPTSIISNTEDTAKRLLRVVTRACIEISERPDNGWNVMVREHTFSTSSSASVYPLPSDYDYMLGETAWDRANYWQMRGGLDASAWQLRKSSIIASNGRIRKEFRINGTTAGVKQLNIDPLPTAVEALVFDYMSNGFCVTSGARASAFVLDTDTVLFKESLVELGAKWRFLSSLHLPYFEAKADFQDSLELAIARDGGSGQGFQVGGDQIDPVSVAQTPEAGFG